MTVEAPTGRVAEIVGRIVEAHRGSRGPLLPILHAVQAELGHVPPSVVPLLAERLNLSRAEVHGVVTFYRDFRAAPPGRVTVRVCRAEACQAVGGQALLEHAVASLGVERGETTPDGAVTLDEVFCLGNCALGPAVQVGDRLHGRVTPARLDALIGQCR
ncbi:formate dehydrogenase subunit gamma [Pseudonocardia benzenivorans]|uniref:NADH dehydrogenase (Ubiquinone) 24 kDa subunit n=2 Tax=Pseudonocardia TaxID=1847 RepID=F4CRE9_PSEUX|nr:formate dehydrogenase subunit gamma [Pseudonocardia dioxanivorans]AEA25240.1 NADH dehydrogenase (ubiquinone) 24 kDa subunit [Pseudonocardia dioxanivorans CB1190]GJF04021.1 formate dehydrogenase subunit gamma [Pseudonocardia sp. D17]